MIKPDDETHCSHCGGQGHSEQMMEDGTVRTVHCLDCNGYGVVCCRCRGSHSVCECPPYVPPRMKANGEREDPEGDD